MSGRDGHTILQARRMVDQLRRERNVRRATVSSCSADLIRYTQEFAKDDVLLTGFPNDKMNPYRPKGGFQCELL